MRMKDPYWAIEETIKSTLEEIQSIKSKKFEGRNSKVWIGRNETIASFFERKLAENLSKVYPSLYFLIDYPIRLLKDEKSIRSQNIYPDIIVFDKDEGKVVSIIELKTDVGRFDMDNEEKISKNINYKYSKLNEADQIEFNKFVGRYLLEDDNERIVLKLKKDVKKIFLIVTERNGRKKVKELSHFMRRFNFETLTLLENTHYNDDKIIKNNKILFDELEKKKNLINQLFLY